VIRVADCNDSEQSIISLLRKSKSPEEQVLVACNFTPIQRTNHVGVDRPGYWKEVLNRDATQYGGAGWGNFGGAESQPFSGHGREHSLPLTLPPLAVLFFKAPPPPAGARDNPQ